MSGRGVLLALAAACALAGGGAGAQSALIRAGRAGDAEALRAALAAPVSIEEVWEHGTALYWAAEAGHDEAVALLLDAGAEIDHACGREGERTPLRAAVAKGHGAVVERLLGAGADAAKGAGSYEGSLAHLAARARDEEMLERLARHGVALDEDSPAVGGTPLHVAAFAGHARVVEALLRHGARANARGELERTPLHLAAQMGHREVVELLLARGADPELVDRLGRNALHLACEEGRDGAAQALRWDRWTPRAGFERADARGWTPAAVAAAFGHARCLQIVAKGEESRTAESLRTALHWAVRAGSVPAAERLLAWGASPDARDRLGLRPADLAESATVGAASASATIDELSQRYAVDPAIVVRRVGGYPGVPGAAATDRPGLLLAGWSDGLVVFAPDEARPGSGVRVGRVDPAAIEATLAVCADLGLFDLPDRSEVSMHAASVRVRLVRGGVRRALEWDLAFERCQEPRDSSRRSFENAWILMEAELRALRSRAAAASSEVASEARARRYARDLLEAPWMR